MKQRKQLVDPQCELSVRRQSKLLSICRSGLYTESKGESEMNLGLMQLIDKENLKWPTKGVLQMTDYLRARGHCINEKRTRRLMRLMNIYAIYPKRNLSKLGLAKYIKPYLLRGLQVTRENQVWKIDITYIPMSHGFMYLSALIDVYSRYVVGWKLSNSLEAATQTDLVNECVAAHGKPEIINSDQGSQYTSALWEACLAGHGIKISMDGKGRATDNAHIERLWRTIKQEYVYLHPPKDGTILYKGLQQYIKYYNNERTNQGIERKIPAALYCKTSIAA